MEKTSVTTHSLGSAVHAARRAADIVWVLQNKDRRSDEHVATRVGETLQAYGEQHPSVGSSDLADIQAVADRLYAVFAARSTEHAATLLNAILKEYAYAPRLTAHGASPWHIHIDSNDHAPWDQWLGASSAMALATLLAEKQRNPGGVCASLTCGRPFIDLGKGGGRLYCSQRCSTRERVATHRRLTTPSN